MTLRNEEPHVNKGFPRVCGDVPLQAIAATSRCVFSPRMRGCSVVTNDVDEEYGVFPAYAGMFLRLSALKGGQNSFPRVCGDVPFAGLQRIHPHAFSPRMRGCSGAQPGRMAHTHVFPAYAGMFRAEPPFRIRMPRFPRVCGDVPDIE